MRGERNKVQNIGGSQETEEEEKREGEVGREEKKKKKRKKKRVKKMNQVELKGGYGYARSLGRFAENLGSVA